MLKGVCCLHSWENLALVGTINILTIFGQINKADAILF
jgi:hypothetical protein